MKNTAFLFTILFALVLVTQTCNEPEVDSEAYVEELTEFIRNLNYDPDELLNVQDMSGGLQKTEGIQSDTGNMDSEQTYISCHMIDYNLKQNADQIAIIRPTNGVIWPGAIVKINESLLRGMPEPVTLPRSSITLNIDLPGMTEEGNIKIENPSNSSTQAAISTALDWWNNNRYEEGYVNASNSSYCAATAYSSTQLAMELGLNVEWSNVEVSAQFNYTSSQTSKVTMMTFKQVFYTITFDPPTESGAVFDESVTTDDLESAFNDNEVPGYVHSVSYGRIIMFRMTTDTTVTSIDAEAALHYSAGKNKDVSADMEAKYKKILAKSEIRVITIGGNADTSSYSVKAREFADLEPIITGKNALYTKDNPGLPIAYTVKFLKDNKTALMGYTTDYTAMECSVSKKGRIKVENNGGYIMYIGISYSRYDGSTYRKESSNFAVNAFREYTIPGGSTNIHLWAKQVWGPTFISEYFNEPVTICYKTGGPAGSPNYETVDCPDNY